MFKNVSILNNVYSLLYSHYWIIFSQIWHSVHIQFYFNLPQQPIYKSLEQHFPWLCYCTCTLFILLSPLQLSESFFLIKKCINKSSHIFTPSKPPLKLSLYLEYFLKARRWICCSMQSVGEGITCKTVYATACSLRHRRRSVLFKTFAFCNGV